MEHQLCTLCSFHRLQFDASGHSAHSMGTGGQEEVSCIHERQQVSHQRQVIRIVENQQPITLLAEPALDCRDHQVLVLGVLLRQVQARGDGEQVRIQGLGRIGFGPQHKAILIAVAIGVFHRGLRFADAAQSADRLRLCQSRRLTRLEGVVDGLEHVFSAGKEGITWVGDGPYLRGDNRDRPATQRFNRFADALRHVKEGLIGAVPASAGDRFALGRQGLQPGKDGSPPINRAHNDRNNHCFPCFVPLHRPSHLHTPAIIGRQKVRADQQ